MAKAKFIGLGACGNKAVINLVEKGVVSRNDVLIANSTVKDIPDGYKDVAVCFGTGLGGCGKERDAAKALIMEAMQAEKFPLDEFLDCNDDFIGIVTSCEGGTGSGASVILADYFSTVVGIPVHLFLFTGFEEDGRGLQNTIEYFKDIKDSYIVEVISNKKFLSSTNNQPEAEKKANDELARRVSMILGNTRIDSEQNIDDTDLYKIITTPGLLTVEYSPLEKVKSVEQFDKIVNDMIVNSKSVDFKPTSTRLGILINAKPETMNYVDYAFKVIREKLGDTYEIYKQFQYNGNNEYIAVIASGIELPIEELKEIYDKYQQRLEMASKPKENFFGFAANLNVGEAANSFNVGGKREGKPISPKSKEAFFSSRAQSLGGVKNDKVKNTTVTLTEGADSF